MAPKLLRVLSEVRISPDQLLWQGIAPQHAGRYSAIISRELTSFAGKEGAAPNQAKREWGATPDRIEPT